MGVFEGFRGGRGALVGGCGALFGEPRGYVRTGESVDGVVA